ncbi:deubiquitinating enzyme [Microbotryomycetes sp. JL201]|nr:deubiquitinating enzyme [Microbotryomycetes sp. JL201]
MANTVPIKIKHSGKQYDATVDLDLPGRAFKEQVHQLTGVEPDKVKVVVKGGMLKDDADMKKLGFKQGQIVMVIGPAGPLPQAPTKPVMFMEDMTDVELAQAVKTPVGLQNLGNTCYMNSTVQVLRAIPELQDALNSASLTRNGQTATGLTSSLRDLYSNMSKTSQDFPPLVFLQMLRTFAPQFAEMSRSGGGYAQQDAQEAWASIVQAVKNTLGDGGNRFIDQYLTGEMTKTLQSDEAPEEPPTTSKDTFLDIKCNISSTTNFMMSGIVEGLESTLEKTSPTLGRQAVYKEKSRISRLPSYLTINLVRFYWRRDISKKTKIMRKIKFPFDLDVMELLTDELKAKIAPVNDKLKSIEKDRRDRAKVRRRTKVLQEASATGASTTAPLQGPEGIQANPEDDPPEQMAVDEPAKPEIEVDEPTKRKQEREELAQLLDEDLKNDKGANVTGMYELNSDEFEDPDKQQWYKFDDDKVSQVSKDKITLLEGGGEDHSAYILLYRSKRID